jgi:hypothetical protein
MAPPTGGAVRLFRQRDIDGGRYLQRQWHDEPPIAVRRLYSQIPPVLLDNDHDVGDD